MKQIMDYNNGHNKELVKEIERIFNDKILFWFGLMIVEALCKKYVSEVYDKIGIPYPTTSEVAKHLWEILTEVCDDEDLEVIIKFVNH